MKVQVKPWTDESGRLLSDVDLQIKSRSWTPGIWEAYLQTLESKHSGRTYKPELFDGFCDELVDSIFSIVTNESDSVLKNQIESAIAELPERQSRVLKLLFWEGKSQNQIAKDWRIQQSSVFNLKERALRNLRLSLENLQGAVNSRFMKGENNSSSFRSQCNQTDLVEVMLAEINRNSTHEAYWRVKK